jgi:hypothetical protein
MRPISAPVVLLHVVENDFHLRSNAGRQARHNGFDSRVEFFGVGKVHFGNHLPDDVAANHQNIELRQVAGVSVNSVAQRLVKSPLTIGRLFIGHLLHPLLAVAAVDCRPGPGI